MLLQLLPPATVLSTSTTSLESREASTTVPRLCMPTFKLVGDNINKLLTPRQETHDVHKQSLHYFHAYAVKDRCDFSQLNNTPPVVNVQDSDTSIVLPAAADNDVSIENMSILVARTIWKMTGFFQSNVVLF